MAHDSWNLHFIKFLDADALIIDKNAGFHMEPLWRTEALVFWKTHLFVQYPKPEPEL